MIPTIVRLTGQIVKCNLREISTTVSQAIKREHPFDRTVRILGNDLKTVKSWLTRKPPNHVSYDQFTSHCDVVIVGGGAMGSSIAYWLKERAGKGLNIIVVERDATYKHASTVLSVGGLRQQFSLPENIEMSLFGAEFLRNIKKYLGDEIDCSFTPNGYLTLASEASVDQLMENHRLQKHLGARNEILTANKLKEKFPWLNVDDIALGCHGLENEGWFDPWSLLYGLKKKSLELGVEYIEAEAQGFDFVRMEDCSTEGVDPRTYEALDKLLIKLPNGTVRDIKFAMCIIAAGPHSGKFAETAKIGTGPNLLSIPLPIEPRKRFVYCFECKDGPGLNTPLTIDPNGTYFRREGLGGLYIGGKSPEESEEPSADNLDVDYEYFDNTVWPMLANRVPKFNAVKLRSAWSGYYEYNTFDQNGIVGPHPHYPNLYVAAGFSGHGIQHAPAIGRSVAEMILDGEFRTIDLTRFGFDRLVVRKPMLEACIV